MNKRFGTILTGLLLVCLGCAGVAVTDTTPAPLSNLSFATVVDSPLATGASQFPFPARDGVEWVIDRWQLESSDLEKATATVDHHGSPALSVTLTESAGARMKEYSQRRIDQRMAVIIDDQIVLLAVVKDAVSDRIIISGDFSDEEIDALLRSLDGSYR